MKTTVKNITLTDGGIFIPMQLKQVAQVKQLISDKGLDIEITTHREKRSLNANNFAWSVLTQIAEVLRTSKEECYYEFLKRYGTRETVSVLKEASHILEREVKYIDKFAESELQGKLFYHYHVYKGSSQYNTKEMSVFIDGVVSEAKELDIDTMTPAEISQLKEGWRK